MIPSKEAGTPEAPRRPLELIVIAGPTAVGKTEVAVDLAGHLGTEIISADSMQVYRHLSIGTAKPTSEELRGIPYHLIDYIEPDDQYHLGRFLADAEALVSSLHARGKVPIVCGGTGMYIKGLLHGVFDEGAKNEDIRKELDERLVREGLASLYAELQQIDPAASHIKPNDRQRILRALEVYRVTGQPITAFQKQHSQPPRFAARTFILTREREALYARIEKRVDAMVESGVLDEVKAYLARGYSEENPAIRALGYEDLIDHVQGHQSLEKAIGRMKQKSRNYAKRQMTWFRAMKGAEFISTDNFSAVETALEIKKRLANDGVHFYNPQHVAW